MSKPPTTLDELGESLTLWETLNNDQPNIEAKFQPLYDQFAIMEKYEVKTVNLLSNVHNNFRELTTNHAMNVNTGADSR